MARSATTSDVFNAIGESRRRDVLDALITGEKSVGTLVDNLAMPQPQVSKHLRVLSDVGLVSWRADGRRHIYCLEPATLRPFQTWVNRYEQLLNDGMDRLGDYLRDLQSEGAAKDA